MRKLIISAQREPFEIGARLFAAIAFPAVNEAIERRRASDAWCAALINATKKAAPSISADLDERFPRYASLDERSIKKALRKTRSRLRDRQVAGHMARGFFQEFLDQRPAVLPEPMARLSLNELSKFVGREAGQHLPENTRKRAWRPSRSVIHLASAIDLVGRFSFASHNNDYDMEDGEMHRRIIKIAEISELVVEADHRFGVKPDEMLRVRLRQRNCGRQTF